MKFYSFFWYQRVMIFKNTTFNIKCLGPEWFYSLISEKHSTSNLTVLYFVVAKVIITNVYRIISLQMYTVSSDCI